MAEKGHRLLDTDENHDIRTSSGVACQTIVYEFNTLVPSCISCATDHTIRLGCTNLVFLGRANI
jgi:hypothetical protein